jgi:hypothetical protein
MYLYVNTVSEFKTWLYFLKINTSYVNATSFCAWFTSDNTLCLILQRYISEGIYFSSF